MNQERRSSFAAELASLCEDRRFIIGQVYRLERFCTSKEMTLEGLKDLTESIHRNAVRGSHFLHNACANEHVTAEIIGFLVNYAPESASISSNEFVPSVHQESYSGKICSSCIGQPNAYPLHIACANDQCPDSAIKMLIKRNPSALSQCCGLYKAEYDDARGLPLHLSEEKVQHRPCYFQSYCISQSERIGARIQRQQKGR